MNNYWYPTQARVDELSRELTELEPIAEAEAEHAAAHISSISDALTEARRVPGFPVRQIPQWMWLASQFRLHAGSPNGITTKAGAALLFLSRRINAGRASANDVQDLNWVLGSTLGYLSQLVDPADLRCCLSTEELSRIDEQVAHYAELSDFDQSAVRSAVTRQMDILRTFDSIGDLSGLEEKVEALFAASVSSQPEAKPAQAALRYLADEDDVVGDRSGLLGLVDDIYVIEWAYAAVEQQTRCLPILEVLLQRWPFVGDLALVDQGRGCLDRFSQYVVGASLYSLFSADEPGLLVLRETGAYPVIAAVMAAIESARLGARVSERDLGLNKGDPVTVSDGNQVFNATYQGKLNIGDRTLYRLGVRDRGTITVEEAILPYIARASLPHRLLSTGNSISVWKESRHIDPLKFLTGAKRIRPAQQESILFLGTKGKFDELVGGLKLLGTTAAALLGVRYVDSHHHAVDMTGSVADQPLIYACSDPSVAFDLVCAPPEHVRLWRVIVDGARLGRTLHAAITTAGKLARTKICIFTNLAEREATADLVSQGISQPWYVEDQDVETPPRSFRRLSPDIDIVTRLLSRHSNHWLASNSFHEIEDGFLESVAGCLSGRTRFERADPNSRLLDFAVSAFLQKSIAYPLGSPNVDDEMRLLGRSIAARASTLRQYDPTADKLYSLFHAFEEREMPVTDRSQHLTQIALHLEQDEVAGVVCRSSQIAETCRSASSQSPALSQLEWLNMEALRRQAPYGRLIVPGWLDRVAMRELVTNGYGAKLDLLFLPFERKWFNSTMSAMRRWERQLERSTVHRLRGLTEEIASSDHTSRRWRVQTDLRLTLPRVVDEIDTSVADDEPDIERIEARAIEALWDGTSRSVGGPATAKAQLVLLEEPGAYVLFPPAGQVIVLSEGDGSAPRNDKSAERQLLRIACDLEPGMVLALPVSGDRDLVDARADAFLQDADAVRKCADLWRTALKQYLVSQHNPFDAVAAAALHKRMAEFSKRMAAAGEPRQISTLGTWIYGTQTVAPRNYRHVVPLLAKLTADRELSERCDEVLQSIDLIYRARTRAAEAIIHDLFTGQIDPGASEIRFELDGHELLYNVHRVRRLAGVEEVPVELIGKVGNLSATPTNDRATAT